MATEPLVSVIMPVFNCNSFIAEAMESILGQTLRDFELIIIDDCSTDKTAEIIKQYNDDRVNLIQKPEKSGLVASLNMGIELARGRFIARMDGDDVSDSLRLKKQVEFLNENPDIVLCGSAIKLSDDGSILSFPQNHEDIKAGLLWYCPLAHPTVMLRNEFITKNNLKYLQDFEGAEDYELWTRCVWLGKMANLPDVLLTYRVHHNQFSTTNKNNQLTNSALCQVNMLKEIWEKASLADELTRELLFQKERYNDIGKLNEIVSWMDGLVEVNKLKGSFDNSKFEDFILGRKRGSIRRFFLNQAVYKPGILYAFFKARKQYRKHFGNLEYVKFALKCMMYKKPNTAES